MSGVFGLHDGYQLPRFPRARLVETNPRADVWDLHRQGALANGATSSLKWKDGGCHLAAQGIGLLIGETRVLLDWDEPMPGCPRPWFECPRCKHRCRYLYLRQVACMRCAGLDWSSRHKHRSIPGYARAVFLRRKISASPAPFSPIAPRPKSHVRYHRIAAEIRSLESKLLDHLRHNVNDVIERRARRGE